MDYKQKYEEALNKAKKELQCCGDLDCDAARQIFRLFPELKESEDERIRKALIRAIESVCKEEEVFTDGFNRKQIVSWLEKQGEQKPSWSEIDEENMNTIINVIHGGTHLAYENEIDWLKSIKDRIN